MLISLWNYYINNSHSEPVLNQLLANTELVSEYNFVAFPKQNQNTWEGILLIKLGNVRKEKILIWKCKQLS